MSATYDIIHSCILFFPSEKAAVAGHAPVNIGPTPIVFILLLVFVLIVIGTCALLFWKNRMKEGDDLADVEPSISSMESNTSSSSGSNTGVIS